MRWLASWALHPCTILTRPTGGGDSLAVSCSERTAAARRAQTIENLAMIRLGQSADSSAFQNRHRKVKPLGATWFGTRSPRPCGLSRSRMDSEDAAARQPTPSQEFRIGRT
jgi:hypothetical protein